MRGTGFMKQAVRGNSYMRILQTAIIVLTLFTAGVHLMLSTHPDEDLRFWFFLNGVGYLVLLAFVCVPQLARFRHVGRLVLIAYAALTICMWLLLADHSSLDPLDAVTKADEIALIILLIMEERAVRSGWAHH